jgi:ubiquinone/menaquinone biosynthesis C-methylase UbiE
LAFEKIANSQSLNILEIGFGNGAHFKRYFNTFTNANLTGIDFSETMCKVASDCNQQFILNGKLSILYADAKQIALSANLFDYAIAINTIYFWNNPVEYLAEIKRLLKSTGTLLLGYRPPESMRQMSFTKHGFNAYSSKDIENMLLAAGFNKVKHISKTYERKPAFGEVGIFTDIVSIATCD